MARKKITVLKHEELLARAKELKAVRVQVVTEKGEKVYKDIGLVGKSDEIQVRIDGDPIIMKSNPGRKGITDIGPINDTVKEIVKRKREASQQDPILQAAIANPDSPELLHQVIIGLGQEAAALAFEREEADRNGKDSSGASGKRIQALRAVGDTWLKKMDQVSNKVIDLDSPSFKKLFHLLIETLRESMTVGGYGDDEINTIVAKMASMLTDEWKTEARNRMKQV